MKCIVPPKKSKAWPSELQTQTTYTAGMTELGGCGVSVLDMQTLRSSHSLHNKRLDYSSCMVLSAVRNE